jgi:subtilase family serine protease
MFRTTVLTLLALTLISTGTASAACAGADPAITSVSVRTITAQGGAGGVNHYNLTGTVVNVGSEAQASNVLQFVDIYSNGDKLDSRGVPPLKPGQSYTFSYTAVRSIDAGKGTGTLAFRLDVRQPSPPGRQDCNLNNDSFTLRF